MPITKKLLTLYSYFILPLFFTIFIFFYPLLQAFYFAFTNTDLVLRHSDFIGIENFVKLSQDNFFWNALQNTILWTIARVLLLLLLGLSLALLLNEKIKGQALFRTLCLIPWAIMPVVAALTWKWMYAPHYGVISIILMKLGLISSPISWLADTSLALPATLVASLWRDIPFTAIMLLSGLQSIPPELTEAASIDGANVFQRFKNIIYPQLKGVLLVVLLWTTIWSFNSFDIVFIMTKGGPGYASMLLGIYTWLMSFAWFTPGYASTVGIIMTILLFIYIIILIKVTKVRVGG